MELESESVAAVGTDLDSANNLNAIESNGSCKNDAETGVDDEISLKNGLNSATSDNNIVTSVNDGDADAVRENAVSEANTARPSPTPPKKGYGLKKWRRIRRNDHVGGPKTDTETGKEKEKEYDSDSTGRMLKRGSANILSENENGNGGSSNSIKIEKTPLSNAFVVAAAATFNAGADSDNSEDGHRSSSKSSSTAATTKLRSSAKHRSQLPKPQQQGVQAADASKKSKGGLELDFERERENSPLSSMGSDSICSNSVFFRGSCDRGGSNSVLPNPPLPESSSDQAQHSPPAEAGGAHSPDSSDQLSSTAANVKDHQLPGDGGGDGDPLVESILMLQSAQLALQAEVQKFGEIGKGICSLCDDLDKTSGIPVSTMSGDAGLYTDRTSDGLNEFNHAYLSKSIQTLERQLNEAEGILKEKELRMAEYETAMKSSESLQDLARSALEQQYRKCSELEGEVQDLIKQKLEAEIQSVVITRSTKESIVLVEDWIKLMGEQKSVISEQTQFLKTVVDVEHKAAMQQEQAEKLDTHNIVTVDSEEILKMQKGIVKLSKRLFIQLVLLGCVFALFVLQLGPKSAVVVPT